MKTNRLVLVLFCIHLIGCAQNKTSINQQYTYNIVVPNLQIPWGFVFLPDGAMLITEKSGELIHFKDGKKTTISGVPEIYLRGQGGLLDIALHPNFSKNKWVYLSYASTGNKKGGGNTTIARAKLNHGVLSNLEILYKAKPNSKRGQHFGSRLVFDRNNYLYFSIGDRGNRDENPQDLARDGGKIYRIKDDGSIPKDNPFVNNKHAKAAIYSYGHRNPQGMTRHPKTDAIWTHEHGPKGGDEINIIHAKKNYGWPIISYGVNYSGTKFTDLTEKEGMEQPLHYWTPSIAPSGMAFIDSNQYGNWKGNLLVGSLKFQYLVMCTIKNNTVVKEDRLLEGIGRVRSVVQGPDGFIYVGVENLGIVKLIRS